MSEYLLNLLREYQLLQAQIDEVGARIEEENGKLLREHKAMLLPGGHIVYLADNEQIERGKAEELGGGP